MSSSVSEDSCPWTDSLAKTFKGYAENALDVISGLLGLAFESSGVVVLDEGLARTVINFFDELLDVDDFQLRLLQCFSLTLVSIVALIFVAWHVYGPRISQRFMTTHAGSTPDKYEHPPT